MANVENLYNSNGDLIYPLTHQKAVIDDSGNPLDSVLTSINENIGNIRERAEAKEQELSDTIGDWDKAMLGTIAEQVDSINGDVKVNQQDIAHNAEAIEAEAERASNAEKNISTLVQQNAGKIKILEDVSATKAELAAEKSERIIGDSILGVGENSIRRVNLTYKEGYVAENGYVVSGDIGYITDGVEVKKDEVVKLVTSSVGVFSAISKYENGKHIPLVIGTSPAKDELTTMYYAAKEDMILVFSGYSSSKDKTTVDILNGESIFMAFAGNKEVKKINEEVSKSIRRGGAIYSLDGIDTDVHTFPVNQIIQVTDAKVAQGIINIPKDAKLGFQVTTLSARDSGNVITQILSTISGRTYTASKWGDTWSEWIYINDASGEVLNLRTDFEIENKFINEILGLTNYHEVQLNKNEGYINARGEIISGAVGFYTDAVHVEKGTLIKYEASAVNVFSAISRTINGHIVPLVLGNTEVQKVGTMIYFVETDMDVIFSGYASVEPKVTLYEGDTLLKKVDEVEATVKKSLSEYEEFIYPAFTNNGYIHKDGTVQNITAYQYNDGINLKEGQSIVVRTNFEYVNLVSVISLKNRDNTYTSIAIGGSVAQGEDGYWTYSYKADSDCVIVLTRRNTTIDETYKVISLSLTEKVETIEEDVKTIKQEIGRDKYRLQEIDSDNPLARINTSAGLTSAIRSWGFIGDSLSSGEIWGFIHEDVTLEPQDVGYRINANGVKESNDGYSISKPFQVVGTYPMLYAPKNNRDVVFVKSDINGTIGSVIPTAISGDKIYTTSGAIASKDYVRISYPNSVSVIDLKRSYANDNYDISWGQFLCRLCGSEGYNYSIGGRQAKTFINGTTDRDLGQLLKDTQKQAYTIALGQNDYGYINGVGDDTHYKELGSAEEGSTDLVSPSSPSNHGDSFVGYYSELICRIKNKFNDSLIFLITCPNANGSRDEISAVIRKIYDHYSKIYPNQIYLIDLNIYARGLTDDFKLNGLHLNSQGYLLHAYTVTTYIDWILRNNIEALNGLPLIGTGATPN